MIKYSTTYGNTRIRNGEKIMIIEFLQDGTMKTIYTEQINLNELGKLSIIRASHVEPNADGEWTADMNPVNGPILGPFKTRIQALEEETKWLEQNIF